MAADVVIRPRLVWRVLGPALLVPMMISSIATRDWIFALTGAAILIPFVFAWRELIIVQDMVAYERRWRWRDSPVDLRRLSSARTEIAQRRTNPQPVLIVTDQAGESFRVALYWHGNWRPLLCLIGHAADIAEAVLDGRTADRIARACPDWHRGAPSASSTDPPLR